jgi:AmiR/NasT family two-component response regulator
LTSFRNCWAAIVCPDDKDRHLLEARLVRLGLSVKSDIDWSAKLTVWRPNVIFFDVDSGYGELVDRIGSTVSMPLIAIVGAETPGRFDWMMRQRPAAYLLRPIRSSGVYTALVMGFHHTRSYSEIEARVDRLERRAHGRRIVAAATTRLMLAKELTEPAAYRLLREMAMRHRTTIEEVSARIEANGVCEIAVQAKS